MTKARIWNTGVLDGGTGELDMFIGLTMCSKSHVNMILLCQMFGCEWVVSGHQMQPSHTVPNWMEMHLMNLKAMMKGYNILLLCVFIILMFDHLHYRVRADILSAVI